MAVEGTYNVTVEAMGKKVAGTLELHVSGNTLTGNVHAAGRTVEVQKGRVNGDSFTGEVEADTPLGHKKASVKGSVSGDTISGELKAGLLKAKFSGTRV